MAFFLFYPRVVSLTALTSIRSRLYPNLIPKYGLRRAIVTNTKDNLKLRFTKWPASFASRVRLLSSSKASGRSRAIKALKFLFVAGGFVFWAWIALSFTLYTSGRLRLDQLPSDIGYVADVYQLDPKGGSDTEEKSQEIRQKQFAMRLTLSKLKSEEAFRRKFGENVEVYACRYKFNITDPTGDETPINDPELLTEEKDRNNVHENRSKWKVCFFLDGSKSSGLVTMEFHKVNTDMIINWIPVSLLVETLPSSGDKICDISAPLPNGITKFTRLFNDN